MSLIDTSVFISKILRHKPEIIGITLDEHGWANVDQLIEGVSASRPFSMELLELIVDTDDKKRYTFNEDKTLIRANQGHSIPVDVELPVKTPPDILYHGTGEKSTASIEKEGLLHRSRLHVHMSSDIDTAIDSGARHGRPVVYSIDTKKMTEDGYVFYCSLNEVWLTDFVPPEYLIKKDAFDPPVKKKH